MPTPLNGLIEIKTNSFVDERGSFTRLFCHDALSQILAGREFCQMNLSSTKKKGTIRGLHFQLPPSAEAKLIRCLRGRVYDVAVDVRKDSPTFLQWHGVELCSSENNAIFIPEGFAHGFQSLEDNCDLLYMHSSVWNKTAECGLRFDDPSLNIQWPNSATMVSARDLQHAWINAEFTGVSL